MYVRQLAGRQAGMIVEIDPTAGKGAIAQGTAAAVTDDEIQEFGLQAENRDVIVPPRSLSGGYRVEPGEDGGWNVFDPGGVKLNKEQPFHNKGEAMDAADRFARRARGLPEVAEIEDEGSSTTEGGPGSETSKELVDYSKMGAQDLRAETDKRGIDSSKANKKADYIALLERDDEIQATLAKGDFEELTIPELQAVAADQNIDLTGKSAKADIVDAVKAGYKPKTAAVVG